MLKAIVNTGLLFCLFASTVYGQPAEKTLTENTLTENTLTKEDWLTALSRCVPGADLEECIKGLESSGQTVTRSPVRSNIVPQATLHLNGTFSSLVFQVMNSQEMRIELVEFIGNFKEKAERRKLLKWIKKQVGRNTYDKCVVCDCGSDNKAPSWKLQKGLTEEVLLSFDSVPDWRTRLKNREQDFINHTESEAVLCFQLPENSKGESQPAPKASSILKTFIQSEFFAGKVTPKKTPE